jgi:hypothetical protein
MATYNYTCRSCSQAQSYESEDVIQEHARSALARPFRANTKCPNCGTMNHVGEPDVGSNDPPDLASGPTQTTKGDKASTLDYWNNGAGTGAPE